MAKSVSTPSRRRKIAPALAAAAISIPLVLGSLSIGMVATPAQAEGGAKSLRVAVDEAQVLRLNRVPGTVIVGNPLIADVAVHNDGLIVIVGKNYGTTNLIALDEKGEELTNLSLSVRTSGINALSLYRGVGRHSMNCSPRCEYEIDVGDAPEHFKATSDAATIKLDLSQGQAKSQE